MLRELLGRLAPPQAEVLVGLGRAGDADDGEPLGQQPAEGERIEGRHELAARQIAGGAEDHQHAIVRRVDDLHDVAVDPHVAAEPVGDEVGADAVGSTLADALAYAAAPRAA